MEDSGMAGRDAKSGETKAWFSSWHPVIEQHKCRKKQGETRASPAPALQDLYTRQRGKCNGHKKPRGIRPTDPPGPSLLPRLGFAPYGSGPTLRLTAEDAG